MDRPRFVFDSAEAEQMAKQSGRTLLQFLPSLVKSAQAVARPPISKYHVGAVGIGSSGRIFFGVNLEFPGLPLNQSVHAEQFLITNLSLNAEPRLKYIAVSAAPCGHCRQFLQELRCAPDVKILITSSDDEKENKINNNCNDEFTPLSDFLPHRFGPDDLLPKDVPLLLEPHRNGLSFCPDLCSVKSDCGEEDLKYAALDAANMSHAPYSGCPSGVALVDVEGKIYKGSYMESAAYNPSLPPVQAALVAYVASGGGGGYERIVGAVVVEKADAVIKQEHTARLLLQCISPKCEIQVFQCEKAI
ncbi:Cytidine deaminase 1 [Hibiscus syriacus]|uniref:cytidine deaminase n=1 Tax=Hibiscus syriacus TaxID=106335 RepID=A0A6A3A260_HIBSY|nr:cytidine deaminase 1-like [Hibiscus syriacus]KAE8698401.1 Cytidine deaminase 1 [Hibiscus syriacus]